MMTVTVFGYLTLINIVLVSIEKIYQTLETVFHRLSNTSNFVKNTPLRVVFSTLFSVFGYPDETLSLVFDILHKTMASYQNNSSL